MVNGQQKSIVSIVRPWRDAANAADERDRSPITTTTFEFFLRLPTMTEIDCLFFYECASLASTLAMTIMFDLTKIELATGEVHFVGLFHLAANYLPEEISENRNEKGKT